MGMADILGNFINRLDSASKQNVQQDIAMQKIDVSNFWKQAQMTFDAGKFLINTKIKLDNQDIAERKEFSSGYNILIDNLTQQINDDQILMDKADPNNQANINMISNRIEKNRNKRANAEGVYEKWYPLERQIFDAGQAGYDISGLQQEGDQLYGTDIDSKALEGQKGGIDRQGGINQASGQMVDKIPLSRQPTQQETTPSRMLAKDSALDIDALKKQVQDLIGEVQGRLDDGQDRQPLNIPGARQPVEDIQPIQPDIPQDVPLTTAQREADKYMGEQGIKFEQESYDRRIAELERKSDTLKEKGTDVEMELTRVEDEMELIQKDIVWAEDMMRRGRRRAYDPIGYAKEGIFDLMGIKAKPTERVMSVKGVHTRKGIAKAKNRLIALQAEIDELNDLAEYEGTQGAIYTRDSRGGITGLTRARPKQYTAAHGETREETKRVEERNKVYKGYQ